jgi:hypothetical protein
LPDEGQHPRMPSLILALHRDPAQSTALRCVLNDLVDADVIVADSVRAALYIIDARTPDLILVDALLPPRDADDLIGYLALLPEASHVQAISVPVILPFSARDDLPEVAARGAWLRRRLLPSRRPRVASIGAGWNPEAFAAEVATYLSLSLAIRTDKQERDDAREFLQVAERRRARRWSAEQAYLVQPAFVMTDRADLVNVSSTGLLVRTGMRPNPGLRDHDPRNQSPLRLSSVAGDAIRRTGTPLRCRTKSLGDGRFLYEVAFRFDEPLDLEFAMVPAGTGLSHPSKTRLQPI